jgi:nitrite reductase/ring-hydroxylating ferredoxin subunit
LGNPTELDGEGYYVVAATADIEEGRMTAVAINDLPIILTRVGDTIHAFSARCPHASGDLTKGAMYRGRIECPDHDYRFDIRTGYPVWPEDEVCRLKKFSIKESDGNLLLKV